ncbi:MAG TPA: hypothetical protein VGL81_31175 [Polyangiaceae bacterium]
MARRTRLLAAIAVVAGAGIAGAWTAACGLPLGGLGTSLDAGGFDASMSGDDAGASDETGVPPGCVALDAACLGVLATGWQPVTVTDAGCGAGFDAATLLVNPRVGDGGCACGACQIVGSFGCDGSVPVSSGDGCNDSPVLVTASPGVCTAAQAQHVEANPPSATGTVGCFVPNDAGTGVTTDPLTVCLPGCSADYCGTSPRCVLSAGDVPCPFGFTLLAQAGTGADPGCPACPCEAGPPGTCGGTVTVFTADSCADSGSSTTYPVGTCNQLSTTQDFESLVVDLVPPDASCSSSSAAPGPADASLLGVSTICCQ